MGSVGVTGGPHRADWGVTLRNYGWMPDPVDSRDHQFLGAPHLGPAALPGSVDMRAKCPPVWDQGELGSCTAQAITAAVEFHRIGHALPSVDPSRLFVYYNERLLEGATDQDSGAYLRDGIKAAARWGVCSSERWAYDPDRIREAPNPDAYDEALRTRVTSYKRLPQTVATLQACLAQGIPFVPE